MLYNAIAGILVRLRAILGPVKTSFDPRADCFRARAYRLHRTVRLHCTALAATALLQLSFQLHCTGSTGCT